MALLEQVSSTKKQRPRRTLFYGVHGIGKSSWASKWPTPVFINIEDGLADIDVAAFPKATSFLDVWSAVIELGNPDAKHGFKTLVIDSVDWLERLIHAEVCKSGEKQYKDISEIPYGRGYEEAAAIFEKLMAALNCVRDCGLHVLLLAHTAIQRFEAPDMESYDRYAPKLHTNRKGCGAGSLVQEFCDEVLFANYQVYGRKTDKSGFNKDGRNVAVGNGIRVIHTSEKPTHLAKNRLNLPSEIEMPAEGFPYGQYLGGNGNG